MSRLKKLREEHGIKAKDLAEIIKLSTSAYSKKENGDLRFSLGEAKLIADVFNTSIEDIFFKDDVFIPLSNSNTPSNDSNYSREVV